MAEEKNKDEVIEETEENSEEKTRDEVKDREDIKEAVSHLEEEEVSEVDECIAQLEDELANEKEEKERYIKRVQRVQADFANYKKRVARDKERLTVQINKEYILGLLPVIDNFERALAGSYEGKEASNLLEGVKMIYRQLINLLKDNGVKEIETVGQEFDPNLHEAVMQEESEEYDSGFIIEELKKGYTFNGIVVRVATVKIAK